MVGVKFIGIVVGIVCIPLVVVGYVKDDNHLVASAGIFAVIGFIPTLASSANEM